MNKNILITLIGASLLVIVLTITITLAGQHQEDRGLAAGSPSREGATEQAWKNQHDTGTNTSSPQLTITLPPENMRYKAPNNLIPPHLTILSPQSGSLVTPGSSVLINATASSNITLAKVEFLVNGQIVCTSTFSPYICSWTVPSQPTATYLIVVRAFDLTGNLISKNIVVRSR